MAFLAVWIHSLVFCSFVEEDVFCFAVSLALLIRFYVNCLVIFIKSNSTTVVVEFKWILHEIICNTMSIAQCPPYFWVSAPLRTDCKLS